MRISETRRVIAPLLAIVLSASSVQAMSKHNISGLSCAKVQAILKSEGNAILRYKSKRGSGTLLYDTFAAPGSYCKSGGHGRLDTVPTADTPSCKVVRCSRKHGGGR